MLVLFLDGVYPVQRTCNIGLNIQTLGIITKIPESLLKIVVCLIL